MNKHAILIMYHDDFYILEKLLRQLDYKKFDIYLHIDKKVKNFNFYYVIDLVKESGLFFIDRMDVKWSAFSQIKCELNLLKQSSKNKYSYYHLISGNDLLLKKPEEIYNFFEENNGYEFVAYNNFNNITEEELSRIKYYHILNKNRRHKNNFIRKYSSKVYYRLLTIQKKLKINRLKNNKLTFRKGANWFSITNDLVEYVLSNEKFINKIFKYSNCADELFLQTLVFNSKFKNKVYNKYNDEHKNIKRHIDWVRGEPYVFQYDDLNELKNSDCFFARKFSSKVDKKIIDNIAKS